MSPAGPPVSAPRREVLCRGLPHRLGGGGAATAEAGDHAPELEAGCSVRRRQMVKAKIKRAAILLQVVPVSRQRQAHATGTCRKS